MKNLIFKIIAIGILFVGIVYSIDRNKNKNSMSDITKANLILINNASADVPTENTGPRHSFECGGIFNGKQRLMCLCENTNNCTDSECF